MSRDRLIGKLHYQYSAILAELCGRKSPVQEIRPNACRLESDYCMTELLVFLTLSSHLTSRPCYNKCASLQHTEIISTLTELYTLLSTSGAIASDLVLLPDHAIGLYPADKIAGSAALAAGYSQEVVDLLRALPYLDVSKHEMFLELLPSTFPITYYGADLGEGYFEGWREVLNDEVMPPSALKLTHNDLYGFEFIYDVKTS